MIEGRQCGPYELAELSAAGVRPATYVWCKGMPDWERAENVADICRFYRRRLSGVPASASVSAPARQVQARRPEADAPEQEMTGPATDTGIEPRPTLFVAIFLTLFCFPITGLVSIYYSYKARSAWTESQRSESKSNRRLYSDAEREQLRTEAHDYARQARMWIGITFFLGIIFYAFLTHRFT